MLPEDFCHDGLGGAAKDPETSLRVARSGGAYGERDATCNCSLIAFL